MEPIQDDIEKVRQFIADVEDAEPGLFEYEVPRAALDRLVAEREDWQKGEHDAVQRHAEAESRYYAMKADRDRLLAAVQYWVSARPEERNKAERELREALKTTEENA
jgi:hypothetical protein